MERHVGGIHPSLVRALKLDDEGWSRGCGRVSVHTSSGAVYELRDDGTISGGSLQIRSGQLVGATYRGDGPIRLGRVVVGLHMEMAAGGKRIMSTRVTRIEEVFG